MQQQKQDTSMAPTLTPGLAHRYRSQVPITSAKEAYGRLIKVLTFM